MARNSVVVKTKQLDGVHLRKTREQLTIGIDLGDRFSQVCILGRTGQILAEGRIPSTERGFGKYFEDLEPSRIAIEAGTHSPWVSQALSRWGHEVIVANPRSVPLISNCIRKSDRVDARTLARVARVDHNLLSPITPRNPATYPDMALLRARHLLVRTRTRVINAIRGVVKSSGMRLPSCTTETFVRKVGPGLSEALKASLQPLLDTIVHLNQQIKAYDKEIERLADDKYPETKRLRQVRGVGVNTALEFVLTIGNPHRFARSRQVGAYLGIQPRQSQSGQSNPQLHITKAGNCSLRSLLTQCAHYLLGHFGQDCDLRRWGLKLAERGGKNAKKRAIVAVARKLAVLLHRLWVTCEPYVPLRNASALPQGA